MTFVFGLKLTNVESCKSIELRLGTLPTMSGIQSTTGGLNPGEVAGATKRNKAPDALKVVVGGSTENPRASRLNRPVARRNARGQGHNKPRGPHNNTLVGVVGDLPAAVGNAVVEYEYTRHYLAGVKKYANAAALARFNTWVLANQTKIDPKEQVFCAECADVSFNLCEHWIDVVEVAPPREHLLPAEHEFSWRFQPIKYLRDGFGWPKFDTLSVSDDNLGGFNNDSLPDNLVIRELFSYLLFNMQTSYVVSGQDSRELRLAHAHKLAQRWIKERGQDKLVEDDLHYSVRVRMTIQRACDNAQNNMLYAYRAPVRNFWLAWLPGPFAQVFLALLVVLAICYPTITYGFVVNTYRSIRPIGQVVHWYLNYMAATVPVWGPSFLVQASPLQNGNMPPFQCVNYGTITRLYAPLGDAYTVTQSCYFTDWAIAAMNEVFYRTSEILHTLNTMTYNESQCADVWMKQTTLVSYRSVLNIGGASGWEYYLELARITVLQVVEHIRHLYYRC